MGLTKPRAAQIYNLDYKQATRVVTVVNITLAAGAPSTVDGVNLSLNDRVLVTGQSTASQNGIYYVTTLGTGSDGTWARTSDGNETGEIEAGMLVMVTEGTIYADTQWKLTTDDPIVIGTTTLTFVQNYSANSIASGNSNVTVLTNANVTISSAGTANVLLISSTGTIVTGTESVTANITAGNVLTGGLVSATGNVTGNYFLGNVFFANGITASKIYSGTSEVNVVSSGGNVNVTIGGTSNVVVVSTAGEYVTGLVSASGNVTGGNVLTGGLISATGNVTGNYINGNIYFANGFSASKIFNGTSEANIGTSGGNANISIGGTSNVIVFATTGEYVTGVVSASGNVTGGNVLTGGLVSATGAITSAANITGGNVLTGGLISATGNATAGNILTGGLISATGNVTGNYINGNGSALTGISTFSNITVTGGSYIAANTISTLLTLIAGNNIVLTANNTSKSLQIDYSSSGGTSIFATGGDMGTVVDPVTSSEDLGDVITPSTTAYDLGQLGVDGVVSNSDIVGNTITGDKLNSSTYISITGNLTAANLAMTSSKTDVRGLWIGTGNSFSASNQSTTSSDVMLSNNGLKAYVLASAGSAYQYSLASAYSVNGASYDSVSFNFASQDSSPQSIARDSTDSVAWMLGGQNATVYQYTYGAIANIGGLVYSGLSFSVASQEPTPTGIAFNTDQSYMYVVGTTNKSVYQYILSSAGNIATASYTVNSSYSLASQDTQPTGIGFSLDGLTMYVTGATNQCIYQYTLTSAFDITTGVAYNNSYNIASQERRPGGLFVDTTKGYIYLTGSFTNNVFQYNIGNSTVITTNATYQTGNLTVGNILVTGNLLQNGNLYATQIQAMMYALAF